MSSMPFSGKCKYKVFQIKLSQESERIRSIWGLKKVFFYKCHEFLHGIYLWTPLRVLKQFIWSLYQMNISFISVPSNCKNGDTCWGQWVHTANYWSQWQARFWNLFDLMNKIIILDWVCHIELEITVALIWYHNILQS